MIAADHISAYYSHDTDHGTPRSGSPMKTESHVDGARRREFLPSLLSGVKANDSQSNNTLQYQKSEKSDKQDTKTHMRLSRYVTTDTCYQSDSFAHSFDLKTFWCPNDPHIRRPDPAANSRQSPGYFIPNLSLI